jgi:hypothetical protein
VGPPGPRPPAEALAALGSQAAGLAGAPRARLEGFLAVAAAYAEALAAAGLEDHEDALHRLLAGLRQGSDGWTPALLAVDGFDDMTPVEETILEALVARMRAAGGEVLVTLPDDPARPDLYASGAGLRARLTALGFAHRRLAGFERAPRGALAHLAGHLFGPEAPRVQAADEVVLWGALDPDDEADLVAREVRLLLEAVGTPAALVRSARDVAVVVPDLDRRGPLFEAALERLGVPVARDVPAALASEPWVRAVAGVLPLLAGRVATGEVDAAALLATLRYRALAGDARVGLHAVDAQGLRWREHGFPSGWSAVLAHAAPDLAPALEHLGAWLGRLAPGTTVADPGAALLAAIDDLVPVPAPAGLNADGRPHDPDHDRGVARALAARRRLAGLLADRLAAAARLGALPGPAEAAADLLAALPDAVFVSRVARAKTRSWATRTASVSRTRPAWPCRPRPSTTRASGAGCSRSSPARAGGSCSCVPSAPPRARRCLPPHCSTTCAA